MKIVNNYGYDVDVRGNSDVIQDVTIPTGKDLQIKKGTNSAKYFVIRIYDRRDGIPISIDGGSYAKITPKSSSEFVYEFLLEPG